jgi:diacylglycerol kinase (ATP)
MPDAVAIINSRCFEYRGERMRRRLLRYLTQRRIPAYFTQYPGHAADIVKSHGDCAHLLVCGGDGTLHQVINAMDRSRQDIWLMPLGRGNSLGRDYARSGNDMIIDLVRCHIKTRNGNETRLLATTSGFGYIARIVCRAERLRRNGVFAYPLAWMQSLLEPIRSFMRISIDATAVFDGPVSLLVVNNTRFAGPFELFPKASTADGRMNVLISDRSLPGNIRLVLPGPGKERLQKQYTARSLVIDCHTPQPFIIDGEIIDDTTGFDCVVDDTPLRVRILKIAEINTGARS